MTAAPTMPATTTKIIEIALIIVVLVSVLWIASKVVHGASPDPIKELTVANDALEQQLSKVAVSNDALLEQSNKLFSQPTTHRTIDETVNLLLQHCYVNQVNDIENEYTILCSKVVRTLDLQCRLTWYVWCHGPNVWDSFEVGKHKLKEPIVK